MEREEDEQGEEEGGGEREMEKRSERMFYKDRGGRDTGGDTGTRACSILLNQGKSLYHFSSATFAC